MGSPPPRNLPQLYAIDMAIQYLTVAKVGFLCQLDLPQTKTLVTIINQQVALPTKFLMRSVIIYTNELVVRSHQKQPQKL